QQNLRPFPVVRRRIPHERSVYGQRIKKVRRDWRLGIRSFQRARRQQTWRRGVAQYLLCLPPEGHRSRPCLHSLRTVTPWITTSVKEAALQFGVVSAAEFDRIMDPRKMVQP